MAKGEASLGCHGLGHSHASSRVRALHTHGSGTWPYEQAVCGLVSQLADFLFLHVLSCFDLLNLFQRVSFDTKIICMIITTCFLIKILGYMFIYM